MSDFFDKVVNDAKAVEEELLGPDYPYYKYIGTPTANQTSLAPNKNNLAAER